MENKFTTVFSDFCPEGNKIMNEILADWPLTEKESNV